ncbi:FecR family protein [Sphingobacterium paludis]|uniref:FecR family protein n=1 Tax=Sphingobacterium paludis TaxID=1476465 RepID=A0A4R7CZY3_9SPHI|nr:FecR family protein [Sphingobacterium paludis]TDS13970.1 FecR family protein [Sphingobacterium paludis]
MDTNPLDIAAIIAKQFKMIPISEEEKGVLERWLDKSDKNKALYKQLMQEGANINAHWVDKINEDEAWKAIQQKSLPKQSRFRTVFAAASIVVLLSFGSYWFLAQPPKPSDRHIVEIVNGQNKHDVLPANLGARIILANGDELNVEDTLNVASNHTFMNKLSAEHIVPERSALVYHTLVVPAANFFKLTLPDGSQVWVNSKSELRFPTTFASSERRVYLVGEAYFEVRKDALKPFYVVTEDAEVKVLGTHFNVNTNGRYSKTSLEEGRVEVSSNNKTTMVFPGQSVQWQHDELRVHPTNLQKDLAWKNNEFYFKEDNIVSIAQQLKLWYDIDVSFSKDVSLSETYTGEISRDVRLSEVLNMLEFVSDLDFQLHKNKLLITKK